MAKAKKGRARRVAPLATPSARLKAIAEIIEAVDNRAMAADGPVTPTLKEMTQAEIGTIYHLAKSRSFAVSHFAASVRERDADG